MSASTRKHTRAMGYAKISQEVFTASVLKEHMEILSLRGDALQSRIPSQVTSQYLQHIISRTKPFYSHTQNKFVA